MTTVCKPKPAIKARLPVRQLFKIASQPGRQSASKWRHGALKSSSTKPGDANSQSSGVESGYEVLVASRLSHPR